jgi:hypothetical protein
MLDLAAREAALMTLSKRLAGTLFPLQAPEIWAAVLCSDGDSAARASFHVLFACAPHDSAPAGYVWAAPAAIAAA